MTINNINLRNTNRDVKIFVINDLFRKKVTINFEEVPVKLKNTDQYSFDNDYLCNAELSSLSPGIELMDRQRTFFARATSSKLTAV